MVFNACGCVDVPPLHLAATCQVLPVSLGCINFPCCLQGHSGYHLAPYVAPFDRLDNRWCCNAPLEALEWMMVQQVRAMLCCAVLC
jgi:hypothetical protein